MNRGKFSTRVGRGFIQKQGGYRFRGDEAAKWDKRSYVKVVGNESTFGDSKKKETLIQRYNAKEEIRLRFNKAFVGRVKTLGSAYNIKMQFQMEGLFVIKVTPLGGNICLLEEMV